MVTILSIGVGVLVVGFVSYLGYDMVRDLEVERQKSVTRKWQDMAEEDVYTMFPIGTIPVEIDSTLFQEEDTMKSIRVVALTRRLQKERQAIQALRSTLTQGGDGKWRHNGKFVSKDEVAAYLSLQENHNKTIGEIRGKLVTLGIMA